MTKHEANWSADPLVWGAGERFFEVFLEPTCPFSARAFGKLDDLLEHAGPDRLRVRIWLHSQPWHMFSGIICRAIVAASAGPGGRESAKQLMSAIYEDPDAFEFEDHRAGPNLDVSPSQLIGRLEKASGLELAEAFQISGLDAVVRLHTRYARQNGIHVSPTFMVDGLVDPALSSGDSVSQWADRIIGPR